MNNAQSRTLLVVHVPKAAGTTLRVILERQYPASRIYKISNDIPGDLDRLRRLPDREKRSVAVVFGHMCWGWHELLAPGQEYQYLTILRDPVERVLSCYAYCQIHGHYLKDAVANMPLYTFLTSGVTRTCDNGTVRQLCGDDQFLRDPYHDMALDFESVTEGHLSRAMANLERCAIVGIAEEFDNVLGQCQRLLGWRIGAYQNQNITRWERPEWDKLDVRTQRAVERHTRLDRVLYERAAELSRERGQQ